jgi:hypothetical protein
VRALTPYPQPSGVHLTLWSSQRAEMTKATCKSLEHWWNAKELLIFSFKPGTKTAIIRSYGPCKFFFYHSARVYRMFFFIVCVLSHWVHAAIVEVADLPSLKCSSYWYPGLFPASVKIYRILVTIVRLQNPHSQQTTISQWDFHLIPSGVFFLISSKSRILSVCGSRPPLSVSFSHHIP